MELNQIQTAIGAISILLLSFIKIPKLEVNIWSWIGKTITKALNKEVLTQLANMNSDITHIKEGMKEFREDVDEFRQEFLLYKEQDEEDRIEQSRQQILVFNDELLQGMKHSKERFDNVLAEIDKYEHYCASHPNYSNNKAVLAIKYIKDTYELCIREHSFL